MTFDVQFARYRSAGVLVDTNLLLLYFIGANDPSDIARFKRTMQFTPEDYRLLVLVLGAFRRIVTTPHIVTEVSNLAGQLTGRTRDGFFAQLATGLSSIHEEHTEAKELARTDTFVRFGITDTAVFHQARGRYLVLTDDFRLSQYLVSQKVDAVNFNHLRQNSLK
jgi:rRNA-processing protein FCF1